LHKGDFLHKAVEEFLKIGVYPKSNTMSRQTPIGLIVKQLDKALTAYTDEALACYGVTRLHWQTLNVIKDADHITFEKLFETMKVFLDKDQLDAVVNDLTQRNWVRREDSSFSITNEGKTGFAELAKTQDGVRMAVMKGISQSDYSSVISILQRMIDNLRV
jgi:DNA-binding MarR family transcriptional regulator